MSRSKLKDGYMKSVWVSRTKNPHHYDEKPKNKLSKLVFLRCPNADCYQEGGSFCSHKIRKEGHRIVSGIVRQKLKEEKREIIKYQLYEDGDNI